MLSGRVRSGAMSSVAGPASTPATIPAPGSATTMRSAAVSFSAVVGGVGLSGRSGATSW